jgi:DNA-binding NarL/FixJ family response regulator
LNAGAGEEIRVMLVDEHATFRKPLAFMLDREQDLTVVAQAGSLAEAYGVLGDAYLEVDVAVVDLDLPEGSGVDFIDYMRSVRSRSMALVVTAFSERERLARAIEAGVAGIAHKSTRPEDVVDAIRRLYSGEQLLSQQEVFEALRYVVREREKDREAQLAIDSLTAREREVLQALVEGFSSDKEIAERLYVGAGTVHAHVMSIISKLGVSSRLQALVFGVRHGAVHIS